MHVASMDSISGPTHGLLRVLGHDKNLNYHKRLGIGELSNHSGFYLKKGFELSCLNRLLEAPNHTPERRNTEAQIPEGSGFRVRIPKLYTLESTVAPLCTTLTKPLQRLCPSPCSSCSTRTKTT